jgi:hypothetical protein
MVARQLTAATHFLRQFAYKANEHGQTMLAPTRVFRQSDFSIGLLYTFFYTSARENAKNVGGGFHIRPQAVPLPHTVRAHIEGSPAETQTKMTAFP